MAYIPLNGNELAAVIANDIKKQLEGYDDFSFAVTYPRAEYKLVLSITGYARPAPVTVEIEGKVERSPVLPTDERRVSNVTLGRALEPPDKIREEAGLVIPQRQTLKTGEIVDLLPNQIPGSR